MERSYDTHSSFRGVSFSGVGIFQWCAGIKQYVEKGNILMRVPVVRCTSQMEKSHTGTTVVSHSPALVSFLPL